MVLTPAKTTYWTLPFIEIVTCTTLLTKNSQKLLTVHKATSHKATSLLVEFPHTEMKPTLRTIRSFGRAVYSEVSEIIRIGDFKPVCYTNINNMCEEMSEFFDKVAQATIPKNKGHRQSLPPWITPSTPNLMKKLNIQRKLVAKKPMSYRKNIVREMNFKTL